MPKFQDRWVFHIYVRESKTSENMTISLLSDTQVQRDFLKKKKVDKK